MCSLYYWVVFLSIFILLHPLSQGPGPVVLGGLIYSIKIQSAESSPGSNHVGLRNISNTYSTLTSKLVELIFMEVHDDGLQSDYAKRDMYAIILGILRIDSSINMAESIVKRINFLVKKISIFSVQINDGFLIKFWYT